MAREVNKNDAGNSGDGVPRLSLRPAEAAVSLGISERLLWSKTNAGEIPCVRIGRAVVYSIAALETWLAEQAGTTTR